MRSVRLASLAALLGLGLGLALAAEPAAKSFVLTNVSDSHDPAIWEEINGRFTATYKKQTGVDVQVKQSSGGYGAQLQAVLGGSIKADVVTLGLGTDVSALHRQGFIPDGWEYRLPHRAAPYSSVIVFVVAKGNPKQVKSWRDLAKPDITVQTTNPKGSRTARFSYLAAYGSRLQHNATEAEARAFVSALYAKAQLPTPPAAPGQQAAQQPGFNLTADVALNWEKDARDAVAASDGGLEIVYPSVTIRRGPQVAVVDKNVEQNGTRPAAEAYLKFLYQPEAQEVFAKHFYRPVRPAAAKLAGVTFDPVETFTVDDLAPNGEKFQKEFFADGGFFLAARVSKK